MNISGKVENRDSLRYENRKFIIIGTVVVVIIVFIIRLFVLQIMDSNYKVWADNNAFLGKTKNVDDYVEAAPLRVKSFNNLVY